MSVPGRDPDSLWDAAQTLAARNADPATNAELDRLYAADRAAKQAEWDVQAAAYAAREPEGGWESIAALAATYEDWEHEPAPSDMGGPAALHYETLQARTLTAAQLDRLPPPQPLIHGILVQNTLAALYGKPGAAKSFIAIDWALSIVTGSWWLGHQVEPGPVLYLAAEGTAGLAQRQRTWQQTHHVHLDDSHPIRWLPMSVDLLNSEWADALHHHLGQIRPALVVIDTLGRSMPGANENESGPMSRIIALADRIRETTRATVLLVHHTPKDGGTLRGHSSLEGAVDTAFEAVAEGTTITLKCAKQKDLARGEPIALQLVTVGESCALYRYGTQPDDELGTGEAALLEAMGEACGPEGLPTSTLARVSELPERTFYRARKALADRGLIHNVGTEKTARWAPVVGAVPHLEPVADDEPEF